MKTILLQSRLCVNFHDKTPIGEKLIVKGVFAVVFYQEDKSFIANTKTFKHALKF